jgi:hypothetical protein
MSTFDVIISCITAIGALATAGAFLYIVKGQKGTQKQIDSLSQMATIFTRHYQMSRIQAGNTVYPKIEISFKEHSFWGTEIVVKNCSYPIEIYRIVIHSQSQHSDTTINSRKDYITVRQGESTILPNDITRGDMGGFFMSSIRLFLITPFDEAYEIRYFRDSEKQKYQSEAIPVLFREEEHQYDSRSNANYTTKEYSIHGNIPGNIEDNFPEVTEDPRDITRLTY